MNTVGKLLRGAVEELAGASVESPRLDAEILLSEATGLSRAAILADPKHEVEKADAAAFGESVARRCQREPVAYIIGAKHFRRIELHVDNRVLIPRPETEGLVEAALGLPKGATVVDVGTGSGAIALALKDERPDLHLIATDASESALVVAKKNADALGLEVELRHGDLLNAIAEPVDAVLSNPPYVLDGERGSLSPEILRYEPAEALFAGPDGLDVYRRLVPQVGDSGAKFIGLEVGIGQAEAVSEMAREQGFTEVIINKDLAGIDRVVVGRRG